MKKEEALEKLHELLEKWAALPSRIRVGGAAPVLGWPEQHPPPEEVNADGRLEWQGHSIIAGGSTLDCIQITYPAWGTQSYQHLRHYLPPAHLTGEQQETYIRLREDGLGVRAATLAAELL